MTNEMNVTRTIAAEDEIWEVEQNDEKGRFLSLDEQLGTIELELSRPLKLSDREEDLTNLQIKAPSADDIDKTQGNVRQLIGKCTTGINPKDIGKLEGRDYLRLQKLIRHFLV